METIFMNIDAEIALKNAEMDKLRLELEKLKAKKNEIMKAERIEQEQKRANTQRSEFEKIFDEQKSDMTIELLHGNGVLENPVIRTQSEVDEVNEAWSDADDIRDFGDIMDTSQHRHYGYTFVSGCYNFNTERNHDMVLDQEYAVTVPYQICQFLNDSVSSYKKIQDKACICVYELPYYDVTVQKYDAEPSQLYEYRRDEDFSDEWDLYVIYRDGSERKAKLK
tara:strand:- start:694 stop:1362 length:669 start_codon:yes stop_codon:yes gene_type:complete